MMWINKKDKRRGVTSRKEKLPAGSRASYLSGATDPSGVSPVTWSVVLLINHIVSAEHGKSLVMSFFKGISGRHMINFPL